MQSQTLTRPPQASSAAKHLRVDCHAHVYDLRHHPFHGTRGFDALACEVGTADQFGKSVV